MHTEKTNAKGVIMLTITAIIWGAGFVAQYLGGIHLGSFSFTAIRCLVGMFIIAIMIFCDNIVKYKTLIFFRKEENIKKTIKTSMFCGIFLFLGMTLQQIAVMQTTTAKAGFISSLTVIVVPIISLFFSKKISKLMWFFIFTSLIGISMLNLDENIQIGIGDFICFLSTIGFSIDIIMISKNVIGIDELKFSFFRFLTVMLLNTILVFLFEELTLEKIFMARYAIIFSGIFVIGVAYTFQIIGEKYCDPIIATLIMSFEGMFAAVFGYFILGQKLNLIQILGAIIMTISIISVQLINFMTVNIKQQSNE